MADGWLSDTRSSYDTDAPGYADKVRGLLDGMPFLRASLTLFAEQVHARTFNHGGLRTPGWFTPGPFVTPTIGRCSRRPVGLCARSAIGQRASAAHLRQQQLAGAGGSNRGAWAA